MFPFLCVPTCVFYICTVCTNNENCSPNEACIDNICQQPCDVHSPCAQNAVCLNVNHGCDCVCEDGFEGNGYALCIPGKINISF